VGLGPQKSVAAVFFFPANGGPRRSRPPRTGCKRKPLSPAPPDGPNGAWPPLELLKTARKSKKKQSAVFFFIVLVVREAPIRADLCFFCYLSPTAGPPLAFPGCVPVFSEFEEFPCARLHSRAGHRTASSRVPLRAPFCLKNPSPPLIGLFFFFVWGVRVFRSWGKKTVALSGPVKPAFFPRRGRVWSVGSSPPPRLTGAAVCWER